MLTNNKAQLTICCILSACLQKFKDTVSNKYYKASSCILFVDPSTGLAWRNRFRIIKGICEGLSYLHQPDIDIVHLDLKPGNILLGENEVPIITDFGLSRCFREGKTDVTATEVVGTP